LPEGGGRTIVSIGIVNPVGIELDVAVVEVEVRRVVKLTIGHRIIAFIHPSHRRLNYIIFSSVFYSVASFKNLLKIKTSSIFLYNFWRTAIP